MMIDPEKEKRSLTALVEASLRQARLLGASEAEASAFSRQALSARVRLGEPEEVRFHEDKGLSVTVYFGKRRGSASTSDFSPQALQRTVEMASSLARHTAADDAQGLADPALLARDIPDLDLWHPWELGTEEALALAKKMEAAAMEADPRIRNSEGAEVASEADVAIYGNSHGFVGGYPSTSHDWGVAVVAEDVSGMQQDAWYDVKRDWMDLEAAEEVGIKAGKRAAQKLGARKLKTRSCPVIFEAPAAISLIKHFVGAASGGALYRKMSFLLDALGTQVFSPWVSIEENPHIPKALASSPFDAEGVATAPRMVVEEGILRGYFLSSYSARKLGMQTTGNAGGAHNLRFLGPKRPLQEMLMEMKEGLFVTDLMGQGVNLTTGDYSRGASGFWVQGGEIAYPVEEITVAGNLRQMLTSLVAMADDLVVRGAVQTGSLWLREATVAGQ